MRYRSNVFGCLLAVTLFAPGAWGQSTSSAVVTVSGGWTSLTKQSSQLRDAGGHVQLGVSRRMQSIVSTRLRLDAGYHSIPGAADPRRGMLSSNVWIGTASVIKDIGSMNSFRPFLIAGAGLINIDEGGRRNHLDLAGGAGMVLPSVGRMHPFVEGRFHKVMMGRSSGFIPLSLGLAF